MKNKTLPQLFIIYTRYLIGFAFIFASIVKLQGFRFTASSGESHATNTAWHFFETMYQSGLYWKFIGLGQLITGLLLVTQRYAKLGAIIFLPIITNVFVITISYSFKGTPIITGLMLIATLLLIVWDWDSLKTIVNLPVSPKPKTKRLELYKIWEIVGIFIVIITLALKLLVNKTALMYLFASLPIVIVTGTIVALKKQKHNRISTS